jgi:hypothetical protein
MDNVQKLKNFIIIPSSQTFRNLINFIKKDSPCKTLNMYSYFIQSLCGLHSAKHYSCLSA